MGRKNNNKHQNAQISAYNNKKAMERMIQKLLNTCVQPTDKSNEWSNFVEIHDLVERIRQQQIKQKSETSRKDNLPAFLDWVKKKEVNINNIKIEETDESGFGVIATEDISTGDVLTSVPETIMLSAEDAFHSEHFKDFVMSQSLLLKMPNVRLALFLHCEKHNEKSSFKPYINILPAKYNTTLYFTKEEMEALKNTTSFSQAIYQFKSIARQYAIFFNLFHIEKAVQNVNVVKQIPVETRNEFTFDAYRWAVSTVTTRQNLIPIKGSEDKFTLGLIPLWDMFNHSVGEMSTDYDVVEGRCKCFAMQDFKKGSEVTICYGKRSNSEFLVHNGFVYADNPFDSVDIALGVSNSDPCYAFKIKLLSSLGIQSSGKFCLLGNPPFLSSELLAFLRVFKMSEVSLSDWLSSVNLEDLKDSNNDVNDDKVRSFLRDRVVLLLRLCKTEEDLNELIADENTSTCTKLAYKLQLENRKVLNKYLSYCSNS